VHLTAKLGCNVNTISGFFPARVMVWYRPIYMALCPTLLTKRTFLRGESDKTLQIQAIGLSLYEPVAGTSVELIGKEVIRTQWL
jgi:hypothetical protein